MSDVETASCVSESAEISFENWRSHLLGEAKSREACGGPRASPNDAPRAAANTTGAGAHHSDVAHDLAGRAQVPIRRGPACEAPIATATATPFTRLDALSQVDSVAFAFSQSLDDCLPQCEPAGSPCAQTDAFTDQDRCSLPPSPVASPEPACPARSTCDAVGRWLESLESATRRSLAVSFKVRAKERYWCHLRVPHVPRCSRDRSCERRWQRVQKPAELAARRSPLNRTLPRRHSQSPILRNPYEQS